jgi:hypothetical protein
MPEKNKTEKKTLVTLNVFACLLHSVSGIVMASIGSSLEINLYRFTPGQERFSLVLQQLDFNIKPHWLAFVFVILAAMDHFACLVFRETYFNNIFNRKVNAFRWTEYSISASLMHVHIALLCGVMEITTLFLVFAMMMTTILFGYLSEQVYANNDSDTAQTINYFGFLPYIAHVAVILVVFFDNSPPTLVHVIVAVIFTLDGAFALLNTLYINGRVKDYYKVEIYYQTLSFVSKTLLAYIAFFGSQDMD